MSNSNVHTGHFGRWVIGEEAAAQESVAVKEKANVFGDAVRGEGRSFGQTDEDRARVAAIEGTAPAAPAEVATDPVAAIDPGVLIATIVKLTGKDSVEVRAILEAQGAIPPEEVPEPMSPLVAPPSTDTPPPAMTDENHNGLPDDSETKGGYLKVAEIPVVLAGQPDLFDRILDLELNRGAAGRKTAFQALLAHELTREGGPRDEVLAVLEARV